MSIVKSTDRVCLILGLVAQAQEGLKHGEVAKGLDIPTSSLSSFLSRLVAHGYLSLDAPSKRYTLGSQIMVLAARYLNNLDLIEISRPIVRELTASTGESAAVATRSSSDIVIVCKEDSPQLIKRTMQIGDRSPMYASASGKAILAYLPEDEIGRYLCSVRLEPLTKRTIKDSKVLQRELTKIRSLGIAYNREELSEDIIAIAAPIFDLYGSVNAAIVVSFPISRTSRKKEKSIEKIVCRASQIVSGKLGFKGDLHFKGVQHRWLKKPKNRN
jgi:DNA-binding IclR family transcriptional regulator